MMCVMTRLNLTLDTDTLLRLKSYAELIGVQRTTAARQLLLEALSRRERIEAQRSLAADYAEGRLDSRAILSDLEVGQLELLQDEDA